MYFAAARWQWVLDPFPHWAPPSGATACLDVRPIGAQATAGGIGAVSLFGYDSDPSGQLGVTVLGDDPAGRLSLTGKTALEDALGLTSRLLTLDSQRLGPAIWEGCTRKADPTGVNGPTGIMPTRRRKMHLRFGPFAHAADFSLADSELAPNVVRVHQRDYRRQRDFCLKSYRDDDPRQKQYLRNLGHLSQRKYPGADWTKFVPEDLPREEPLDPATTRTDDFNRSDGPFGSSSEGWSWSVVREGGGGWVIASNQGRADTINAVNGSIRADADLSSDDHSVQAVLNALSNPTASNSFTGVLARFQSDAETYYKFRWRISSGLIQILRWNAGTPTALETGTTTAASLPDTMRIEVDGSDIEGFINDVSKVTHTDVSPITGTLRGGLGANANGTVDFDDFEAADLAAGGTVTGSGALTLANFTIAAEGVMQPDGAAALTLANMTIAGSGAEEISGSAALSLANMLIDTEGVTGDVTGTAAMTLANFVIAASADETMTGAAALSLANMTLAASGESELTEGTATLVLANMVLEASGVETLSGEAALELANMVIAGEGIHDAVGTAALQLNALTISAQAIGGESRESIAAIAQIIRRRRYH